MDCNAGSAQTARKGAIPSQVDPADFRVVGSTDRVAATLAEIAGAVAWFQHYLNFVGEEDADIGRVVVVLEVEGIDVRYLYIHGG